MRAVLLLVAACGRVEFDAVRDGAIADAPAETSALVPGGTFARSYDGASDGRFPDATHVATVSAFRLDLHEVTVARFRRFVDAGGGTQALGFTTGAGAHPRIANSGWDPAWNAMFATDRAAFTAEIRCDTNNPTLNTWTDAPGANEALPINCLAWFEAMAFCIWDGGYLPTDAEWNFAAAGGDEQRAFPWSVPAADLAIDGSRASYGCRGDDVAGCTGADVLADEARPAGAGRWGHVHLAGNLWEWVLDANLAYPDPCVDCANLDATAGRAFRGGSFFDADVVLRVGERRGAAATARSTAFGVRCARDP